MDDLLRRQVIGVRQHRNGSRLLVVSAIADPKLIHLPAAFRPQLYPGEGMNAVVDAGVHWDKTAEHLRVGCVHDGVNGKTGDIPLPDRHAVSNHGDLRKRDDPFFADPLPQVFILQGENGIVQLLRHANVHQRAQDPPFALVILRRL